jgi:Tfp pilus assembly protein PilX
MLKPLLTRQHGNALVTSLLVMFLFTILGVTTLTLVDQQQKESGRERVRESSFSLAEGVLNSQIYLLSRQWPGEASQAYSGQCTIGTSANPKCPDHATMQTGFTGNDYTNGMSWTTEIHDNTVTGSSASENFYDDAAVRAQAQWDSNRDGYMWVRAQGLVRGKRRTLVALVKAEDLSIQFPRNAVVAGKLHIAPNGNQTYLTTSGSYVTLRCTQTSLANDACRGWEKPVNVGPNATVVGNPSQPPALSPEKIDRLRETAKALGTYYASGAACPASDVLNNPLVFIERSNDCDFEITAGGQWNSLASPGVLVIGSGMVQFTSNKDTYYGIVYNVNGSDKQPAQPSLQSSGTVVEIKNACIYGSIVIDGPGGLDIGSNNGANYCDGNMKYDANVANRLRAFGTAGIVQNSFREITASS